MATRGQSKYMPHLRKPKATGPVSDALTRHDSMIVKAKTNEKKGQRGGDCNRTQCQRPNAWWYNKTMQAYYCGDCAGAINESCTHKDHIVSFGSKVYVMPPSIKIEEAEGAHRVVITTADGTSTIHSSSVLKEDAESEFIEAAWLTDLRSDGSAPFHYSELRDKMIKIRALIAERYPDEKMVEFV